MKVDVLGPLRAEVAGVEVSLGGPQQRLVFALLVVASGKVVTTEQLMDRVWRDDLPDNARKTVQVHVSNLRRALGDPDLIRTAEGGYHLTEDLELDVDEFERLVAEGRDHLSDRPEKAGALLRQALSLWRASAYADLGGQESLLAEIDRLGELCLSVVEDRLDADIAVGRAAVSELEMLIDEHPLRERLRALHMTALYRSGRQAEALASYRYFRETLTEEYGLDPSPELQDLELQILQQDPSLGPALPRPVAPATASPLPTRYSSFVGRDEEAAEILDILETNRLVTLVGPGGIGKSSLAGEALRGANQSIGARFVWVDVEATQDGGVALAVAQAMGLQPGPSSDPEAVIVGYARERPHVLLFDGCEPLIDEVAVVADRLLQSCPELRILATSREPLGLSGEATVRVGSLDPAGARLLFCERGGLDLDKSDEATLDQIEAVCAALDGIPLAIELAAARLGAMPLGRLVRLLDDQVDLLRRSRVSDPRHGSLAAALEWSYRLLDEQQQRLFRILAVFRRGFEIGAAATAAGEKYGADSVDRLMEVSLIQPPDENGLYRMLEPIRQYAQFLLDDSGEQPAARNHHTAWFAQRCVEVRHALDTPRVNEAARWVAGNRFDLAAALEWSLHTDEPDIGISILAALAREIANQGYGGLLLPFAEKIVLHPAATPSRDLAIAMAHTTHLLHMALDNEAARVVIDRAEALARDLDDPVALGSVLLRKAGFVAEAEGARPEFLDLAVHAVSLLEEAGHIDPLDYFNVAFEALCQGEMALAEDYAHRCLAWEEAHIGRSMGDIEAILAPISVMQGDLEEAIRLKRRAATSRAEAHVLFHASNDWIGLASYLTYADRYDEAAEALDMAAELSEMVGADHLHVTGPRMRVEAASGDTGAVLRLARDWFDRVQHTEGPLGIDIPNIRVLLHGEVGSNNSAFLDVLLPLTQAVMDRGDTEACKFAHAAPALMGEAAFEAWDSIGETQRWQRLADRCARKEHRRSAEMSLEQAFHEAARFLGGEKQTAPS